MRHHAAAYHPAPPCTTMYHTTSSIPLLHCDTNNNLCSCKQEGVTSVLFH